MLTIEPINVKYSTAIHRIISDPQLARTSDIPSSPSLDDARAWIGRMKRLKELRTGQIFVILVNDLVVGVCGLYGIDNASGTAMDRSLLHGRRSRHLKEGFANAHGTRRIRQIHCAHS